MRFGVYLPGIIIPKAQVRLVDSRPTSPEGDSCANGVSSVRSRTEIEASLPQLAVGRVKF